MNAVASSLVCLECRNELRIGVQCNKRSRITNTVRVVLFRHVLLLLSDVAPYLINLQLLARKIAQLLIHHFLTSIPDANAEPHNCVAMNIGDTLYRADGRTLNKTGDDRFLLHAW